ncbi:hypothetical protein QAD02_016098 [Eretmocerus hayati]|uniref:Uncharacterized protein n=1 Tax=Eretmocerus hayati TaxID=131215 RepID=A0ACC2PBF5_9HYME|nr:hypothetical protein QAD02_016098 [Eretmocerus hayati]
MVTINTRLIIVWFLLRNYLGCYGVEALDSIDYILNYVKKHRVLSVNQVTLIVESVADLQAHSSIAKRITDELPTVIMDNATINALDNRTDTTHRDDLKLKSERKLLRIAMVNLEDNRLDIKHKLTGILNLFIKHNPMIRGKCLIFSTSGNYSNYKDFLKIAWSHKFLDLTIIEWAHQDLNTDMKSVFDISGKSSRYKALIVHHYNPYKDEYVKDNLTAHTDILPDKLMDLNGYPLRTGFFENIPAVMIDKSKNNSNMCKVNSGFDVTVTEALSEALNFKPVFLFSFKKANPFERNILRHHSTEAFQEIQAAFRNNQIDFLVNLVLTGSSLSEVLEDRDGRVVTDLVYFPSPSTHHLIVKQRVSSRAEVSRDFLIVVAIFIIVISIFMVSARLFKFNLMIWTSSNISTMMCFGSIQNRGESNRSQKIFKISIYAASAILFSVTADIFMNTFLFRQNYNYDTLQDLADSGMTLSLDYDTKKFLTHFKANSVLQSILNHSEIGSQDTICNYRDILNYTIKEPLNGCLVGYFMKKLWNQILIDENTEWVMSWVQEPVIVSWDALAFDHPSPYIDRINLLFQRFLEAGLIDYWWRSALWKFNTLYQDVICNVRSEVQENIEKNIFYSKPGEPIRKKILYFLAMGYSTAFLVFLCEILVKKFETKKPKEVHKICVSNQIFLPKDFRNKKCFTSPGCKFRVDCSLKGDEFIKCFLKKA